MNALDLVEDVTDVVEEAIKRYGNIMPGINAEINGKFDGKWKSIPSSAATTAFMFRGDKLKEKGIDPASLKTFSERREAALAISGPDFYGWGLTPNQSGDGYGFLDRVVIQAFGGHYTDETGQIVQFNSPETVAAYEWLAETYDRNGKYAAMLPPGVESWNDTGNNEAWLAGQHRLHAQRVLGLCPPSATTTRSSRTLVLLRAPAANNGDSRDGGTVGGWLTIFKGAPNTDLAKELALDLLDPANFTHDVRRSRGGLFMPAYENLWTPELLAADPNYAIIKEQVERREAVPRRDLAGEARAAVRRHPCARALLEQSVGNVDRQAHDASGSRGRRARTRSSSCSKKAGSCSPKAACRMAEAATGLRQIRASHAVPPGRRRDSPADRAMPPGERRDGRAAHVERHWLCRQRRSSRSWMAQVCWARDWQVGYLFVLPMVADHGGPDLLAVRQRHHASARRRSISTPARPSASASATTSACSQQRLPAVAAEHHHLHVLVAGDQVRRRHDAGADPQQPPALSQHPERHHAAAVDRARDRHGAGLEAASTIRCSAASTRSCRASASSIKPLGWLSDPHMAMGSVISVNVWKGIPFFVLLLLSGLKAIDKEQLEAAEVDGANVGAALPARHPAGPALRHRGDAAAELHLDLQPVRPALPDDRRRPERRDQALRHPRLREGHRLAAVRAGHRHRASPIAPLMARADLAAGPLHAAGRQARRRRQHGAGHRRPRSWAPARAARQLRPRRVCSGRSRLAYAGLEWLIRRVRVRSTGRRGRRADPRPAGARAQAASAARLLVLFPFLVFVLFPFFWIVITSLKTTTQISERRSIFWPQPPHARAVSSS